MNAIKIIFSERIFFYIKILHFFFENTIVSYIFICNYFKSLFNRSNLFNNRRNNIHNNLHTIKLS